MGWFAKVNLPAITSRNAAVEMTCNSGGKNKKLPDHIACFVALEHPRFINSPVRDFAQASFAK